MNHHKPYTRLGTINLFRELYVHYEPHTNTNCILVTGSLRVFALDTDDDIPNLNNFSENINN